ncbi:serine endopeptidase [Thozetella sp. PMI_491]|nr:serine endopeptidase [Thozetella sp. PMI_491]
MRVDGVFLALAIARTACAGFKPSVVPRDVSRNTTASRRFIVEAASGYSLETLQSELQALCGSGVEKIFNSPIFTGISIECATGNIDSLKAVKAASSVWRSSQRSIETAALSKRDTPSSSLDFYADQVASPNYTIHRSTGVESLHKAGIYGKGAQIAIISSGVYYEHPSLGGCFGDGCKVAGGYDLAGDGCWPAVGCPQAPDKDPLDLYGYGTLAAGIVGGYNQSYGYYGVAPEATIYAYKVFAGGFPTDDDTMLEALLMAYDDGADVITCAAGVAGGYENDALSDIASRLVDAGVIVSMGMGDQGLFGAYYSSNGASGKNVLAVASVEADSTPQVGFSATVNIDGGSKTVLVGFVDWVAHGMPVEFNGRPIIPLTLNSTVADDACAPLPSNIPDYSEAVPLIRLGGCPATTKQANIVAAGIKHMIFYYNDDSTTSVNYNFDGSFIFTISPASGAGIVNTYVAGGNVTANYTTFPDAYWVSRNWPQANQPAAYSGWGPLGDLSIKPDIAAPGDLIYSTYPHPADNGWYYAGGTEMSAAYIAGVAALYIGKYGGRKVNPNYNATDLVTRIISSGTPLNWWDVNAAHPSTYIAPVSQVGAGLVNASKVLEYTTTLSVNRFELNDTRHFERYQKVSIKNNANVQVTYTFGVIPAAGFETWLPDKSRFAVLDDLVTMELNPTITLPSGTFKISPGQSKVAQFNFAYPDYSTNLPLYSGSIIINSSLGESLTIPYLGVSANLQDFFPSIFSPGYPYILSGRKNGNISTNPSWSFDLSLSAQDFPKLLLNDVWSTDELRWDIFASGYTESIWVYPPVVGQSKFVGSATYWAYSDDASFYDPNNGELFDKTVPFPLVGVPRTLNNPYNPDPAYSQFWWLGGLADGTTIPKGSYVMRVAALSPFGDPTKAKDWDIWTLPFTVS